MNPLRRPALLCLGLFLAVNAGPLPREPSAAGADAAAAEEKTDESQPPPEKVSLVLDPGGHTGEATQVDFTPDGKEVMTVSHDGTVRFWDVETGETVQVLRPSVRSLNHAALAPDGRRVAVGTYSQTRKEFLTLLLTRDGDAVRTFSDRAPVNGLAFSPDGKWLASVGHGHLPDPRFLPNKVDSLRLWDLEGGTTVRPKAAEDVANGVAFAPDGTRLVTGTDAGACGIWSREGQKLLDRIERLPTDVRGVAWSPDGREVATAGTDGVRLWDVAARKSTLVSELASFRVRFSGDGKKLLYLPSTEEAKHTARVYDLSARDVEPFALKEQGAEITAGALSRDGSLVACAGGPGHALFLWRTAAPGEQPRRLGGRSAVHNGAGIAPDGKTIAWGDPSPGADALFQAKVPLTAFFSLEKLTRGDMGQLPEWAPKQAEYLRAELSRDDLSLELHADRKGIDVIRDGTRVCTRRYQWEVQCATLLPGGRFVVGTKSAPGMPVFNAERNKLVCRLPGHPGGVVAVACSRDGRYLLSTGGDMTLRLWDLERIKPDLPQQEVLPTLSLFVAGRDWVTWTPEGYYAASPEGDRLMGWRVDNGPDRLASFYPAEQFRKALYRPDLVKRVLEKGSVADILRADNQADKLVHAAEVLPPNVVLVEPARAQILGQSDPATVPIRATADSTADNPVTGVQLLVDGRPLEEAMPLLTRSPNGATVEAKWQVRAPAGSHRFSVLAQTAKGSQGYSGDVLVNNLRPPPGPRLFFLAIGIDAYKHFAPLACAVNDARSLEAAIRAQGHARPPLFDAVETRLLVNDQATRRAILDGLDWLRNKAEVNDVVVISYAGHGERSDRGEFQLLTAAYDPDRVAETTVSGKELKAKLAGLRSRRVLVLLDACHSGTIALGANDALAGELKQRDCGAVVLCAAAGDEYSLERDGHGLFTRELLAGLAGAATNDANEITLARLYVHVEEKVPKETEDQQHPVLVGLTAIRSFPLARPEKPGKP
jgi:WD40 repeat protein